MVGDARIVQGGSDPGYNSVDRDGDGDSESCDSRLDDLERRLTTLEHILRSMYEQRRSIRKRSKFEYIEFWLSTTVRQSTCARRRDEGGCSGVGGGGSRGMIEDVDVSG